MHEICKSNSFCKKIRKWMKCNLPLVVYCMAMRHIESVLRFTLYAWHDLPSLSYECFLPTHSICKSVTTGGLGWRSGKYIMFNKKWIIVSTYSRFPLWSLSSRYQKSSCFICHVLNDLLMLMVSNDEIWNLLCIEFRAHTNQLNLHTMFSIIQWLLEVLKH